ncbi:hypothetical protein SAMN05421858_0956 [Haladaptatus litoreus]|uniref:Uncharacterized protein n=1 Tax=Haladaptatus litoreus TaxID=553468 RepID=A0A1N6X2D7_9EURY|nr:hypothetical protein [Haladaptatus litoreus]SIQ96435.1 hypothetical protein SAMN05421858_0956 [Haladaptatus litoreus]
MTENSTTIARRQFVKATIASTAVLGGVSSTGAAQSNGNSQFAIKQGGKCIPIEPLSLSGLPIEEFYDYRTPDTDPMSYKYASFGTENLQRDDTSIMFLYDGPKGLSLVMVHDKLDSDGGGAVSFRITNLPVQGKFVVKDDSYDDSTNHDTFDYSKHRNWNGKETANATIHWTWQGGRSDGAVYRGLGNDFEFTIHPQFNGQALLSDQQGSEYEGQVNKWEVLSGNANNPTRTKLKMNEKATITSNGCGSGTTETTGNETTNGGEGTTTGTTSNPSDVNSEGSKGFFAKLWDGISSILNSVVSFFTNLF